MSVNLVRVGARQNSQTLQSCAGVSKLTENKQEVVDRHEAVEVDVGGARCLAVRVLLGEVFQGDASRLLALDPLRVRPVHLVQLFLVLAAVLRMHLHPEDQGGKGENKVLHDGVSWVPQGTARVMAPVSLGLVRCTRVAQVVWGQ